jgi:acyl-CoA synthetase (NDP forming)
MKTGDLKAAFDRLLAYQKAEEEGRLLMGPVPLGTKVYVVKGLDIYEDEVLEYALEDPGKAFAVLESSGVVSVDAFGEKVFRTEREAYIAVNGEEF